MKSSQAFTLIELLVVVLIIGILAAIAVPQYQKAVLKSRFTQAKALGNALAQAEEIYHLANGTYTKQLEDLSIDMPAGGSLIENGAKMAYPWGNCYIACEDNSCGGCTLKSAQNSSAVIYFHHFGRDRTCYVHQNAPAIYTDLCKSETGKSTSSTTSGQYTVYYY